MSGSIGSGTGVRLWVGGMSLAKAAERWPGRPVAAYVRVSSHSLTGHLQTQKDEAKQAAYDLGIELIVPPIGGVEKGYSTAKRKHLKRFLKTAHSYGAIGVARDSMRWMRPTGYSENPYAMWTTEDTDWILEEAEGVPLTVWTRPEKKSLMNKPTKRPGRKPTIDHAKAVMILRVAKSAEFDDRSLRDIATQFGVPYDSVRRLWSKWRGYPSPALAYRRAYGIPVSGIARIGEMGRSDE